MKITETWATVEARISNGHKIAATRTAFAAGVRAVAVEVLMHSKDILNAEDSGALYTRLMASADRVER